MNRAAQRNVIIVCCLVGLLTPGAGCGRGGQQESPTSQNQSPNPKHEMPGMTMGDGTMHMGHTGHLEHEGTEARREPGRNQPTETDQRVESDAVHSMQTGHRMNGAHMRMTPARQATPEDLARADEIASALRSSIERYKDYRLALADGYRIFLPNLPQPQYHFNNYWNGYLEAFTFDPARPTSLLYKKTKNGYELAGAMYTAPRGATLEQLNERVPLGIAQWHAHTNLCMPQAGRATKADRKRFGLTGSISTPQACKEAGGRFYPQVFGWMVHVYPFESSRAKIWTQ